MNCGAGCICGTKTRTTCCIDSYDIDASPTGSWDKSQAACGPHRRFTGDRWTERLVCDLVGESTRFDPAVICLRKLGPLGEALRDSGIPVRVVGMERGPLRATKRLWGQLRAFRPAVVHCHNLLAHLYGSLAPRERVGRAPSYSRSMALTSLCNPRAGVSMPFFCGIHTPSPCRRTSARYAFGRSDSQAGQYITSQTDSPSGPSPTSRRGNRPGGNLGWPEPDYYAVVVARLVRGKGHLLLLDAFRQFVCSAPNAKLIVVGDGPIRGLQSRRQWNDWAWGRPSFSPEYGLTFPPYSRPWTFSFCPRSMRGSP